VSGNTVGTLMRRIYAKLGVHRRAELVTKLAGLGTSLTGDRR
jgi:DNA-binding CsgD family transcriptional regulator